MRTSNRRLRVLIADDNVDAADTLALLVQLSGCEAVACYDGPTAAAAAEWFRPHLCLFDLCMPGMDGDQLAERVRKALAGEPVRFVALTAMSGDAARRRIERAGFSRHLVKPASPEEIAGVLADAAAGS